MAKRIVMASPKGASGKTRLSRGLAAVVAYEGRIVATADLDPQASLTIWARPEIKYCP